MTCTRCHSRMLPDVPLKYFASAEGDHADTSDTRAHCTSYRCIACGNYTDPTISANRAKQAKSIRMGRTRKRMSPHIKLPLAI